MTYIVDKETSVLKAPGVIVVMRLSYKESNLTELSPVNVSLFTQLIMLLLSILKGFKHKITLTELMLEGGREKHRKGIILWDKAA